MKRNDSENLNAHIPVMLNEVLEYMRLFPGARCIDMTVGLGGHAEKILERISPKGKLLCFDRDGETLLLAKKKLEKFAGNAAFIHSTFENAKEKAEEAGFDKVNAVLFDLGVSSLQLDTAERGLSHKTDGPLDMRLDRGEKLTAAYIVNAWREKDLVSLFREYGDEPLALQVARAICKNRPFTRTTELANLVIGVYRRRGWRRSRIHPATRVFQALRMFVNREPEALKAGLEQALKLLDEGGRMVVISFHSGEDRIVKRFFAEQGKRFGNGKILTRKPIVPSAEEVRYNSRARSAKMRAFEKGVTKNVSKVQKKKN